MKIYLASRWTWKPQMRFFAEQDFMPAGFEITSRWVFGECDGNSDEDAAQTDLLNIEEADILICYTDGEAGLGMHVEFGYALAKGKEVYAVGETTSVFHALPQVGKFNKQKEVLGHLKEKYSLELLADG